MSSDNEIDKLRAWIAAKKAIPITVTPESGKAGKILLRYTPATTVSAVYLDSPYGYFGDDVADEPIIQDRHEP